MKVAKLNYDKSHNGYCRITIDVLAKHSKYNSKAYYIALPGQESHSNTNIIFTDKRTHVYNGHLAISRG